jgi:D-alanyl-lipoteichoic acid acyltransferase DltB (MBOAT superfamily)
VGLARGDIHTARGYGKEGASAVNGAWPTLPISYLPRSQHESLLTWFFVLCMQFGERWWYRHACAAGGVFNILLMMGANLVGFVLGMDGAQYFAHELVSSWDGKSYSESPSHTSLIDVPIQVFSSSSSHVLVCSLACRLCLNIGMSVCL